MESALQLTEGLVAIAVQTHDGEDVQTYSQALACTFDGLSFDELQPRNFSFNSPYGACQTCDGLGVRLEVDAALVVPDPDLSIADGALAPWSSGRIEYWDRVLDAVAESHGFSTTTPWKKLPKKVRDVVLYGSDEEIYVKYKNRYGRTRSYWTTYEGVVPVVERRHVETDSESQRERLRSSCARSRAARAAAPACVPRPSRSRSTASTSRSSPPVRSATRCHVHARGRS